MLCYVMLWIFFSRIASSVLKVSRGRGVPSFFRLPQQMANLKNGCISQTSKAVILKFHTYLLDTCAIIWPWLLFDLKATPLKLRGH